MLSSGRPALIIPYDWSLEGLGEVYFHRNGVIEGKFDGIQPGSKVRLEVAECESDQGWQATTSASSDSIIFSNAIWRMPVAATFDELIQRNVP